jgi:hypothetical protein
MSFLGREPDRKAKGMHSSGAELDRKYWVALGLYAVLAVLVWLTMGEGKVFVELPWFDLSEYRFIVVSKPVEMRLIPLIFIGGFALRTVLTRQAEKIRRSGEKDSF